jgi:hypothetical protein
MERPNPTSTLAFAAAALAAAAVFAQPAAAAEGTAPARDCIGPSSGVNWTAHGDNTIVVRSGARAWRVTTGACPRLNDPLVRIVVEPSGGTPICTPKDARLYVASPDGIRTPCFIQSITPLTPDEARALEHGPH